MELNNGSTVIYQKANVSNLKKKKTNIVGDFFYGFFLTLSIFFLSIYIALYNPIIFYFSTLLLIILCVFYFKKGRPFVMVGIISFGLIMLLIFGSCLYNLNNNFLPSPGQPRIF